MFCYCRIDLSSIASPYHLTHLSPFTGIVDTSEMTLSDTADFYNYQQEELNLQQIDSCILSGVASHRCDDL